MKLSVVIPCYNAADTIAEQLEAFTRESWSQPWEIVVVDNRSSDNSMAIVKQFQERLPNLRIVQAWDRQGQPYALNTGVESARGESVALCDADDVIGQDWVAFMGDALADHDFVACRFDTVKLNDDWLANSRANNQQDGLQQYKYPPFLPHAGGGSIGFKRDLHALVAGFDEALPMLHDTDFCWKLQLKGYEIQFVPEAVMYIRFRSSFSTIYRQARNYAEYNVLLYKRYQPFGMPKLSLTEGVRQWAPLFRPRRLLKLRHKAQSARWVWQLGWRVGRVRGSIKHRILAF